MTTRFFGVPEFVHASSPGSRVLGAPLPQAEYGVGVGGSREGAPGAGAGEVRWVQISSAKYLHFHFEIADGQNTKIPSKYQNPFDV